MYNIIVPILMLFIALMMILDGKKYLRIFNSCIGIVLGGFIGINIGRGLFGNIIGSIFFFIIFMLIGYYIDKIKKIELLIVSGLSWGVFSVIIFAVLKLPVNGLIFLGLFFFISGAVFSIFYYSEILMIAGYSFLGANILFISCFYGLESITRNVFEVFNYPYSFYKFIHLYRINFFYFFLLSLSLILFSVYFQRIKGKETKDRKFIILNNVLNESGYLFAIYFFLTEALRIIQTNDTTFIFGVTTYNWPIFAFLTYWLIGYIRKQEEVDFMAGVQKRYKVFLYIYMYSIFIIPLLSYITNFKSFSLADFFCDDIKILLPKWIFTLIVLPLSIYLIYPKYKKKM